MDRFTEYLEDEDKLVKPLTLILGLCVILVVLLIPVDAFVKEFITNNNKLRLAIYITILGSWVMYWCYVKFSYPKNNGNKLGVIIIFTTEGDKVKVRLRVDIVNRFNELIAGDGLQDWINLVLFKNHQAKRIIPFLRTYTNLISLQQNTQNEVVIPPKLRKEWLKLRNSIKGSLYIYGHVSERQEGENAYFFDTAAPLVVHPPLSLPVRKELSQDFVDIWPNQFVVFEKVERKGLEFTANYWYLTAKYMIGCAAFACGDFVTALKLHQAIDLNSPYIHAQPNPERVKKRITTLLAEDHARMARFYLETGQLAEAKQHIDKCLTINPQNYSGNLQRAIIEFTEANPKKALGTIRALSRFAGRDRTWMYSESFLLMYLEQFDKALASYRKISNYTYEGEQDVLEQVIKFNVGILEKQPDKIQSHFILGYLKYKKKINYPEALEHLETFLEKATNEKYELLVEEARTCLTQLREEMGAD